MGENKTIWITGASGFLGANLVEFLLNRSYKVIITIRPTSSLWRLEEFLNHPNLIKLSLDEITFNNPFIEQRIDILFHCAWGGVDVNGRNDWTIQIENFNYSFEILKLAKILKIKKIIGIGSQAEYGFINERIDETYCCNPNTSYGAAKLSTFYVLKEFCEQNNIEWYWVRLFSFFGKKENNDWLVTSVIRKILLHESNSLTYGEQKFDYSNISFILSCFEKLIHSKDKSGLYNLGSNTSISIKDLITIISNKLNDYSPILNFGAIPYRINQSMQIEGNSNKFYTTFEIKDEINLDLGLADLITDLKTRIK